MITLKLPQEGDSILCSCGAEIGTLVTVNGHLWMRTNAITLRNYRGYCNSCGKIVHFNSLEIQLDTLVNHVLNMR